MMMMTMMCRRTKPLTNRRPNWLTGIWSSAALTTGLAKSTGQGFDSESALTETIRDFLPPAEFYSLLTNRGLDFFAGVPDSLLKDFCAYVQDNTAHAKHIICANEGASISVAAGYHLSTQKTPVVYMQNSGFGNSVNPLVSLCDPAVYSLPMLLLIGWRGEPGKRDESQHLVQGRVTPSLLADLGIPFQVLPDFIEGATAAVDTAIHTLNTRQGPYALLVRRQCFSRYKLQSKEAVDDNIILSREEAIELIISNTPEWDAFVATTGFTSRELYELRMKGPIKDGSQKLTRDFLTVGSMGHASAIALGIAMGKPSRNIWCLDGDGACLMHMGNMTTIGSRSLPNFKHIILNNGAHDSVGGQPTGALNIDFPAIAKASGYKTVLSATTSQEITSAINLLAEAPGPSLLEIRVIKGARKNLGRPNVRPVDNKHAFMKFLSA
uniref:Phosphonopyruvate decarboxylase n=1 Tax=Spongospora subterranea TaxID=70186 RepID=A0A0H5R5Y1_9EUKA|eukprot:CRZ09266.1 hypothetical protein [Spongospora subterranea]